MMINGVPMNGMETRKYTWVTGVVLIDVASSIQVQRGLGASKVSTPSVGGSQKHYNQDYWCQKGGFISYGMGNDGYSKVMFSVSSGLTKMVGPLLYWVPEINATVIFKVRNPRPTLGSWVLQTYQHNHQLSFTALSTSVGIISVIWQMVWISRSISV